MKFGIAMPTHDRFTTPEAVFPLFDTVEELGYDSIWFGDHVIAPGYAAHKIDPNWLEVLTCMIAGAARTSRIGFGSDVLVVPYRNPVLVAKMIATAAVLFGDRIQIGAGVGYIRGEFEALGAPPRERRGAATDEYLKVMRLLFDSNGPVSFAGEWVRFDDVHFGPKPSVPPPLIVGGNHARALRRAALLGDGWHPLFPTPADYANGCATIARIRSEEAIDRPFLRSYCCPPTRILAQGEPYVSPPVAGSDKPDDFDYAPAFPLRSDGSPCFVGTAAQLIDDLSQFQEAGVEQVVLRFILPWDQEVDQARFVEQMQKFASDVMPLFKHRADADAG